MQVEPQENNGTRLRLYDRLAELSTRWTGLKDSIDIQEARYYIDAGLKLLEDRRASGEYAAFLTYQAFWHIRQLETATYVEKAAIVIGGLNWPSKRYRVSRRRCVLPKSWMTFTHYGLRWMRLALSLITNGSIGSHIRHNTTG
jgi:hypothetical protein